MTLPHAQFKYLTDPLQHIDRFIDRCQTCRRVIGAHPVVHLLHRRMPGVIGKDAQHGHPLRRQPKAILAQAREQVVIARTDHYC